MGKTASTAVRIYLRARALWDWILFRESSQAKLFTFEGGEILPKKLEEGGTHYTPDAQLVQCRIIETTRQFVATSQLLAA
jgi:hypothetical protein